MSDGQESNISEFAVSETCLAIKGVGSGNDGGVDDRDGRRVRRGTTDHHSHAERQCPRHDHTCRADDRGEARRAIRDEQQRHIPGNTANVIVPRAADYRGRTATRSQLRADHHGIH